MRRSILLIVPALCLAPAVLWAQPSDILNSGRRTLTAERMQDGEGIVLDGVLDEPAWKRATSAGEFIQQDPVLGGTPTEATDCERRQRRSTPSGSRDRLAPDAGRHHCGASGW